MIERSSLSRPKRRKPAQPPPLERPESTVIYEAARPRHVLRSPHLLVTSGPRKGMEIPLAARVTTIGRGEENTVVIPDISVSRQHVSLTREDKQFVLQDQGSGNGTLVNGKPVQRHSLAHLDELTMGDTKVRFVEPGSASPPKPAEAPQPQSLRVPLALCALLVFACGILMLRKAQQRRSAAVARARVEQTKALAQRWLQEGSALGKENQWAEALDRLTIAAELDGQDVEIRRAVEETEGEIARERAKQVPVVVAAEAAQPERAKPEPARPLRKTALEVQPPDVQKVLAAYLAGDLAGAIDQAARSLGPRGPPLLEQLRHFEAARRDGLAFVQEQKLPEALQALAQAQSEDRDISQGKGGRLGRELRKAVSQVQTQLAAVSAQSDDGLPAAADQLRTALREDPANEQAAKALKQIGERCQELYLRGYVSKDDDLATARAAFKLVAATLPAEDATAQKAHRWLDKLDGKIAKDE